MQTRWNIYRSIKPDVLTFLMPADIFKIMVPKMASEGTVCWDGNHPCLYDKSWDEVSWNKILGPLVAVLVPDHHSVLVLSSFWTYPLPNRTSCRFLVLLLFSCRLLLSSSNRRVEFLLRLPLWELGSSHAPASSSFFLELTALAYVNSLTLMQQVFIMLTLTSQCKTGLNDHPT